MANTVINTPELLNLDSTTGATVLAKGTVNERPPTPTFSVDYLVVAGGGGGGTGITASTIGTGGGGGAGGLRTSYGSTSGGGSAAESSLFLTPGTSYTVTIGSGGSGGVAGSSAPNNGQNSVFSSITSIGGGAGGSYRNPTSSTYYAKVGGSGGGAAYTGGLQPGAAGTTGQGYAGGDDLGNSGAPAYGHGGGGGAGAVGVNGGGTGSGAGGAGLAVSITGSSATYGGGGGGGGISPYPQGAGGSGGGGAGGLGNGNAGVAGTANTGGGGGGGGKTSASGTLPGNGANGGSGIVILRYSSNASVSAGAGLNTGVLNATVPGSTDKYTTFISGTGSITFTYSGTSDEYPINGTLRFNTDTNKTEYYDGTGWYEIVDEYASGFIGPATNYFDTKLYTGNGATQSIGGYINGAASFNGSSSKIDLGNNSSNNSSTISVSLWFKTSGHSGNGTLINNGGANSGETGYYLGLNSNGTIKFEASTGTINGSVNYADSNWHQIVLTLNNGAYNIYVDGNTTPVITGSGAFTGTATRPTWIGQFSYTASAIEFFNGSIDQVRIYNVALSSSDVAALNLETAATATTAAFPSGQTAVATYTMDTSANGLLNTQDLSTVNYPAGAGCIALYEMNGNVNDTSGTYNGTPTNITYEGGAFDQAAVFNGSSAITLGTDIFKDANITFSAWINPNVSNTSVKTIYGNTSYVNGQQFHGIIISARNNSGVDKVFVQHYPSNTAVYSTGSISLNGYTHIAVSYGSQTKIYINGSLDSTHSASASYSAGQTLTASLGAYILQDYTGSTPTGPFSGSIDQVRIFNTALTQTQVTTLARGIATSYSGTATNVNFNGYLNFAPGLVWIKARTVSASHSLQDTINGEGQSKNLYSDNTGYLGQYGVYGFLSAFGTNGFSVNVGSGSHTNANNQDYVSWNWKAGGTAVTNNDGTIASQVSANKDAGFSIVKWNGNGTTSQTVGHGLSSAPQVVIMKSISGNSAWYVLTTVVSGTNPAYLQLESTAQANSATFTSTSTTFTNFAYGGDTIAYCFHSVAGYSKIGLYTGTGTTSGNFVETGFEPSFVMVKRTNGSGQNWVMFDNKRSPTNPRTKKLAANLSSEENNASTIGNDTQDNLDFSATGFRPVTSNNHTNILNGTYLYMAIA